jgi:hypothetical protein
MSKTISVSSYEGIFDTQLQNSLIVGNGSPDPTKNNYSKFTYIFPQGAVNFGPDTEIALNFISMWNAYYNITDQEYGARYNNNYFSYQWPDGANDFDNILPTAVTIPNGYYTFTTLNTWFQSFMIQNNHYLIDANGNYVFFMEWIWNPTYFRYQLITYALPTILGTYTQPSGATWSLPTSNKAPQVQIYNPPSDATIRFFPISNFKQVVGFPANYGTQTTFTGDTTINTTTLTNISINTNLLAAGVAVFITGPGIPTGTYIVSIDSPTQVTLSNNATLSTTTGTFYVFRYTGYGGKSADFIDTGERTTLFQQVSQVNVLCSLLSNQYKVPSTILYTFSITSVPTGSPISIEPQASLIFLPIIGGQYTSIQFTLVDQEYREIFLEDPNVVINVVFRCRPKLLN